MKDIRIDINVFSSEERKIFKDNLTTHSQTPDGIYGIDLRQLKLIMSKIEHFHNNTISIENIIFKRPIFDITLISLVNNIIIGYLPCEVGEAIKVLTWRINGEVVDDDNKYDLERYN